jgi:hypothetical protein
MGLQQLPSQIVAICSRHNLRSHLLTRLQRINLNTYRKYALRSGRLREGREVGRDRGKKNKDEHRGHGGTQRMRAACPNSSGSRRYARRSVRC